MTEIPEVFNFTFATTERATTEGSIHDDHWPLSTVIRVIASVGGLVGNTLMAALVLRKSNRGQPDMWILLNLCVANTAHISMVLPWIIGDWKISGSRADSLCKFLALVGFSSKFVCCYTLGLYSAILFIATHFRKTYQRITRTGVVVALAVAWGLCILICIPFAVNTDQHGTPRYCGSRDVHSEYSDSMVRLVLLLLLPLVAMAALTGCALWRMRRASRQMAYARLSQSDFPSHRRTAVLLLVLLLVYLVSWFPIQVIAAVIYHNYSLHHALVRVVEVCQILSHLNPVVVPFVCIALDSRLTAGIRLFCLRWRHQPACAPPDNDNENLCEI